MAIDLYNTAEGGTNGTGVTTGNSAGASGDAVTPLIGTGCTATYATAAAFSGNLGFSLTQASGAFAALTYAPSGQSDNNAALRFYYRRPSSLPTVNETIGSIRATGNVAYLRLDTTGKLQVMSASDAVLTTFPTVLDSANYYRIEMRVAVGTSSTTGTVEVAYYLGNSTTPVDTAYLATNVNAGTVAASACRVGRAASHSSTYSGHFDNLAFGVGRSTMFGPPAANVVPTASAGADKDGSVGAAVSLTGTDSDSDGTVTARQWSVVGVPPGAGTPTLTNPTMQTVSFTPSATGVYTLQYQVTDNAGANSAASQAKVYVAGLVARPLSTVSNTGPWANTGGAASLEAALADEVSSTYAESQNTGTSVLKVRLSPMQVPTVFNLKVDHLLSAAGSGTATVKLYKGATTIKTWTLSPTTSSQQTSLALTSGEITSVGTTVTDWRALDVEITWAV